MKRFILFTGLAASVALFYACNRLEAPVPSTGSGEVYLDLPGSNYRYYEQSGKSGDSLNARATLGRVLFYDRHLSINNSISCGSCHKQVFAFSDNVARSAGFENRLTGRNSPAIQNLIRSTSSAVTFTTFVNGLFWDGRENNLQTLNARPISNHVEMGVSDLGALVPKLAALEYYKGLFRQAYSSDQITLDRMTYAMATFLGAIRSVNTRLDQANLGKASLSALEIEGQTLFDQKYNCGGCHNVTAIGYSSGQFRDIGLDASYTDAGREAITGMPEDKGKFKVPNLRNVALTGPYMHDGRFKTLDDVLEHYSHNIKASANLDTVLKITGTGGPMRMEISAHEKQAIIAFLGSLVDVDMITNPAYSDPFKTK